MKVYLFIIISVNFAWATEERYFGNNKILPNENFNVNFNFESNCYSKCKNYRRIGFYSIQNNKCIIWSHSSFKEQKTAILLNNTFCAFSNNSYWCATNKSTVKDLDWGYCKEVDCDIVSIEHYCGIAIHLVTTSSFIKMNSNYFCKNQNCLAILYTEMNKCFFTIKCSNNCQQFSHFKSSFFPSCINLMNQSEKDDNFIFSPLPENTGYEIYIIPIINLTTMGSVVRMFIRTLNIISIEKVYVLNNTVKWLVDYSHNCFISFEGEYYRTSLPERTYTFSTDDNEKFLDDLIPETYYMARVRILLNNGSKCDVYKDFTPWVKFRSNLYTKGMDKIFLLLISIPVLILLQGIIFVCLRKRRNVRIVQKTSSKNKKTEKIQMTSKEQNIVVDNIQITTHQYSVQNFVNYIECQTKSNYEHLTEEYELLGQKSTQYQSLGKYTLNIGQMVNNLKKNRFSNIVPYDHSRVILKGRSETDNYINASYIPNENNNNKVEYIAAQGPISKTVDDFWKMIWDENISLIIMLTDFYENGNFKCIQYWPAQINTSCEYVYDPILEVLLQKEDITNNYIERKLKVRNKDSEEERIIIQIQMVLWYNNSIPDLDVFEGFLFHFHKLSYDGVKTPYLFHCCAGVGRTGTFTVIDRIIRKLVAGSQEIDVFNEVLELRKYRVQMVQPEAQYIFIHMFIKYFIDKYMKSGQENQEMMYSND